MTFFKSRDGIAVGGGAKFYMARPEFADAEKFIE
jgi:hypothetical protein